MSRVEDVAEPDPGPGNHGAWREFVEPWLVSLSRRIAITAEQVAPAHISCHESRGRSRSQTGHPMVPSMPHRLLSRRVHFPQSPPFEARGLLFGDASQGAARAGPLQGPSRRSSQPRKPNVGDTRAKWIPSFLKSRSKVTNTASLISAVAATIGSFESGGKTSFKNITSCPFSLNASAADTGML